jgi:PKD repeat protein
MKNIKTLMTIFTLTLFYLALSCSVALAANIVIDKQSGPAEPGLFHTHNYANDAACIQVALDYSKSGDTITIRKGDYNLTKGIVQTGKNLNIIGEGKVTFNIRTSEKEYNDIFFGGSLITSTNLSTNAYKGSSQVVITDASKVRQNDLIKIWKNVQWCPLPDPDDYPDQMTGEIYAVKSVNGNVVTLNQPLLRDYRLSEIVQVEIYRPIQMNIKNIRIEDTGAATLHHGLALQYCKDSSVTDSWFNNSGFGAVCLYSCFNVSVNNNEMYNSLRPGSGYGVNAASGSAFINIEHNHIENCRHAVTGNSAELKSLNRDVLIADNTLIGAINTDGSNVVDAHADTINFVVTRNKIYPTHYAFSDGTQQSIFSNNEVFGGFGGVYKRGSLLDGVHIYENNTLNNISRDTYEAGNGNDDTLIIRNNSQNNGTYGVCFLFNGSFRNITISGNTFSNLSNQGVYQKFLMDGVNLNISENTFANIALEGIYIDGNSFKNGAVKIQNNNLINVNTSNSSSGITVKKIQNAIISGNQIFKVPAAAFSASLTSGYAPLTIRFTDRSTGPATSWKWSFGDGTSSTQMNPSHTYNRLGKYNVSLTVRNAAGINKVTKRSFINVNALKPPLPAFSASPLNGKAPMTVRFTDKSTNNPDSWSWDFGDKSTSTLHNPVHKYAKAGKYAVKLTVKNSKGTNWVIKKGYIVAK